MRNQKPYLNPKLTLSELSKLTTIPPHKISQVINRNLGMNFYKFINLQRIKKFNVEVLLKKNEHLTIVSIAEDCGFTSKTSFNRTYKSLTGITPSEYMKKNIHKKE